MRKWIAIVSGGAVLVIAGLAVFKFVGLASIRGKVLYGRPDAVAETVLARDANPLAAGDGSLRFRGLLEAAGVRVAPDGSQVHVVRGLHICLLAARTEPVPPEAVLPTYIRAPDARPASP